MHEAAKPHTASHPQQRPRETALGRQRSSHPQGNKCSLCQGNPGSALSPKPAKNSFPNLPHQVPLTLLPPPEFHTLTPPMLGRNGESIDCTSQKIHVLLICWVP